MTIRFTLQLQDHPNKRFRSATGEPLYVELNRARTAVIYMHQHIELLKEQLACTERAREILESDLAETKDKLTKSNRDAQECVKELIKEQTQEVKTLKRKHEELERDNQALALKLKGCLPRPEPPKPESAKSEIVHKLRIRLNGEIDIREGQVVIVELHNDDKNEVDPYGIAKVLYVSGNYLSIQYYNRDLSDKLYFQFPSGPKVVTQKDAVMVVMCGPPETSAETRALFVFMRSMFPDRCFTRSL